MRSALPTTMRICAHVHVSTLKSKLLLQRLLRRYYQSCSEDSLSSRLAQYRSERVAACLFLAMVFMFNDYWMLSSILRANPAALQGMSVQNQPALSFLHAQSIRSPQFY
jgi:hypothetical protein